MKTLGVIPFAIDVKGGDKAKRESSQGEKAQHDDRGSKMGIAINDKGGDYWLNWKLSLMSIVKVKEAPWVQQAQKMEDYALA